MKTSIHFSPVKNSSETHNKRTRKYDHVRDEFSHKNESLEIDLISERRKFINENYKNKVGQKMQDKMVPIREGVVVIKDDTTMEDLKNLSRRLEDELNIKVFQIHIHKDEGHYNSDNEWKSNLHAHIIADWTNHQTGKTLKLNKNDLSHMQTIAAEALGMERGITSDKKHLNAISYKVKAEEKRLNKANEVLKLEDYRLNKNLFGNIKAESIEEIQNALKLAKMELKQSDEQIEELNHNLEIERRYYRSEIESKDLRISHHLERNKKLEEEIKNKKIEITKIALNDDYRNSVKIKIKRRLEIEKNTQDNQNRNQGLSR